MSKRNLLYMLINPFNPLVECAFAFGGVKPFVHATFRPFSLSEWEFEIVLFQGIDTSHAVLNAISQVHSKQYIYPRHPELDSGAIQDDFLSISINRFRVKHGMTIKGALDTVSREHAILPLSKGEDRMLNER